MTAAPGVGSALAMQTAQVEVRARGAAALKRVRLAAEAGRATPMPLQVPIHSVLGSVGQWVGGQQRLYATLSYQLRLIASAMHIFGRLQGRGGEAEVGE